MTTETDVDTENPKIRFMDLSSLDDEDKRITHQIMAEVEAGKISMSHSLGNNPDDTFYYNFDPPEARALAKHLNDMADQVDIGAGRKVSSECTCKPKTD